MLNVRPVDKDNGRDPLLKGPGRVGVPQKGLSGRTSTFGGHVTEESGKGRQEEGLKGKERKILKVFSCESQNLFETREKEDTTSHLYYLS